MATWSKWFNHVMGNPGNLDAILAACIYYEDEIETAMKDLNTDGVNIEELNLKIPGMLAYRINQFKELEGILKLVEGREKDILAKWLRFYLEGYPKTINQTAAEKYAAAESEAAMMREARLRVAHARNLFEGLVEGLNAMSFRIGDVVKLRLMGIEDSTL